MDILTVIKNKYSDELAKMDIGKQIKFITKKMKEEESDITLENAKVYIANYEKKIPKLSDNLSQSFEIMAKEFGSVKTPTVVKVVGYNADNKKIIILSAGKLYQIDQSKMIKSVDDIKTAKKTTAKKKTDSK